MNGECARGAEIDAWDRSGAAAPLPDPLEQHLASCGSCRERVRSIRELRQLCGALPQRPVGELRLREIRFVLMAETRQQKRRPAVARRRWLEQPARALLQGAALLLLLVSGAFAMSRVHANIRQPFEPRVPERHPTRTNERSATSPQALEEARTLASRAIPAAVQDRAGVPSPSLEPTAVRRGARPGAARPQRARFDSQAEPPPEPAPAALSPATSALSLSPAVSRTFDDRFRDARVLLAEGHAAPAAQIFDGLVEDAGLDAPRRADALYWAARAHLSQGDLRRARSRAERYLSDNPRGWYRQQAASIAAQSARLTVVDR